MRRSFSVTVFLGIWLICSTAWCQGIPPTAAGAPTSSSAPPLPAPLVPSPIPVPPPPEGSPAPPPSINQIQLHVWISEANEQGLRELGANLQYTRVINQENSRTETNENIRQIGTSVFNAANTDFNATLPAPDTNYFPLNSSGNNMLRPDNDKNTNTGVPGYTGGGLVSEILDADYGTLDSVFRGLERTSDLDLISRPELVVVDNGVAEIHVGEQVPFQSVSYSVIGAAQLGVQWKEVGVNLKLQPLVLTHDTIQIDILDLSVSDVARYDNIRSVQMPVFSVRSQIGRVVVPNAQALVIGGLSSRSVSHTERRVPIIGEIPLIGIPFRGRTNKATNSQLLIFVQPTLLDLRMPSDEALNAINFWKDRQWENKDIIEKEVEVMTEGM